MATPHETFLKLAGLKQFQNENSDPAYLSEDVPELVQHCVRSVAKDKGGDTKAAFAICVAQLQKSGYLKPGSMELTAKGAKKNAEHKADPDAEQKSDEYEALLKLNRKVNKDESQGDEFCLSCLAEELSDFEKDIAHLDPKHQDHAKKIHAAIKNGKFTEDNIKDSLAKNSDPTHQAKMNALLKHGEFQKPKTCVAVKESVDLDYDESIMSEEDHMRALRARMLALKSVRSDQFPALLRTEKRGESLRARLAALASLVEDDECVGDDCVDPDSDENISDLWNPSKDVIRRGEPGAAKKAAPPPEKKSGTGDRNALLKMLKCPPGHEAKMVYGKLACVPIKN